MEWWLFGYDAVSALDGGGWREIIVAETAEAVHVGCVAPRLYTCAGNVKSEVAGEGQSARNCQVEVTRFKLGSYHFCSLRIDAGCAREHVSARHNLCSINDTSHQQQTLIGVEYRGMQAAVIGRRLICGRPTVAVRRPDSRPSDQALRGAQHHEI